VLLVRASVVVNWSYKVMVKLEKRLFHSQKKSIDRD
jgi:hypothetical protein